SAWSAPGTNPARGRGGPAAVPVVRRVVMRRALQAVVTFTSLVIAGAGCGDDSSPGPTISSGDVDAGSDRMDPAALDKFVDPLPVLPAVRGFEEDGSLRQVTIGMWEIEQQLHRELPSTRVWAYGEN